jgi:ubiquinone/menaquinone biosynthesis C-methylase UbiE
MTSYAFDNAWQRARQRLTAIETWLDPDTIRHLAARGVGPGWHCLEVGAGGGSIAAWLADRVGPSGSVVATDLDTRFVEALSQPNIRALRHNIGCDPLPEATFDLAHERLVLMHVPRRDAALDRLVSALKPGGWLVLEEMDFVSAALDPRAGADAVALFERAMSAHHRVLAGHDFVPFYGRCLLGDLQARELTALGTEGRSMCISGGSAAAMAWQMTFEQLREELVATGEMTADEVAAMISLLDDPTVTFLSQTTVAAWGQRPIA